MATLKKYDLKGNQVGEVKISDDDLTTSVNEQMLKDYLIAIRSNRRQWSANTKERNEVNHSTAKPHPQKGTGRARQGSLAAPQYKGGGVVFGPKPKFDQHVKINKKEKRAAIRYLLSQKIANGKMHILASAEMSGPKTKVVYELLSKLNVQNSRVMFLAESPNDGKRDAYHAFTKSMRNIQKKQFKHLENVNGYDLALNENLFIMDSAFDELKVMLGASE
ncbi:MAG: 50S ribosomal protein L4 [Chlamydiales bacterium]|nr:50S ribosomal protein L4 [Chlamydiales bacterium]